MLPALQDYYAEPRVFPPFQPYDNRKLLEDSFQNWLNKHHPGASYHITWWDKAKGKHLIGRLLPIVPEKKNLIIKIIHSIGLPKIHKPKALPLPEIQLSEELNQIKKLPSDVRTMVLRTLLTSKEVPGRMRLLSKESRDVVDHQSNYWERMIYRISVRENWV